MELSDITNHRQHHQSRHSKHQSRHRKHHVAHTASDQRAPVTEWPTREEHAREGNRQSLVDTWLEDIETPRLQPVHSTEPLSKEHSSKEQIRSGSTYHLHSPSPRRVLAHKSHNVPILRSPPRQNRRQHRRRDLVKDNAILDLRNEQDTLQAQPGFPKVIRPVSVGMEPDYESAKKRSHTGSEGSAVSISSAAQHHFEKKARYKTRSDRYDTMRVHNPRKAGKRKRKKSKDQNRRNENRRAGDFFPAKEVMDNFNSESILSDRITMQPTVRPGLFDNGKASKNQLPDLTFHDMHFLKRPPPPKPVPRGRERAKRRGQKELEEVSAFFLHKGITDSSGISGRDQPEVGGASSIDRETRDGSSYSIDVPTHRTGPGEQYGHMSPVMDRESSRGATNWTWSSSCVPPERGIARVSVTREHAPAQSSTPPRAREALERTGIFDNTGISCAKRPERVLIATSRSKSGSSNREPLTAVSSDIVNRQSDTLRQNVRIVRYYDRGVMASEEAENIAGCRQKAQAIRPDAVEQPSGDSPVRITASANSVKCSRFASEDQTASVPQVEGGVDIAAPFHAADHDTGLDRPRSPKCTAVKQLEAAAEKAESRELQNHLTRGWTSLPVQEDVQSASGHHFRHFPSPHDDSQYGRLGTILGFVGDRQQLDLFEADQEINSLNTVADWRRDSQRAHEVSLTPRFAMKPTSGNSPQVSNIEQPAIDVRIPSIASRGPSRAQSEACYNLGTPSSVHINPPSSNTGLRTLTNNWASSGHGQLTSNYFLAEEQPVLSEAAGLSPQRCSPQQSLAEYIAQMENEVLGRPQEDGPDGHSPIPSWHGLQDNDAVYLMSAPQPHQSYVGAYERDLSEDGHMRDRSIGGNLHGGGGMMGNSDVDREEQRFMSTFWRPNCS